MTTASIIGPHASDDDLTLLTDDQLAELVHHSPKSLERWRLEGCGPKFLRVGRKPLYRLSDVKAWLKTLSVGSTSERLPSFDKGEGFDQAVKTKKIASAGIGLRRSRLPESIESESPPDFRPASKFPTFAELPSGTPTRGRGTRNE